MHRGKSRSFLFNQHFIQKLSDINIFFLEYQPRIHKLVVQFFTMVRRVLNILLLIFIAQLNVSCSEKKEETSAVKEEGHDDEKEEESVVQTAEQFLENLLNYNFEEAIKQSTKSSYSSVKLISKYVGAYTSIYEVDVKECEVEKEEAICMCEFVYYDDGEAEQEVKLKKFDGEWLVDFQLGITIDNVFLYNYGYEPHGRSDDGHQIDLGGEERNELIQTIDKIVSSDIKIGFSTPENVESIEPLYEEILDYGYGDLEVGRLMISTYYTFEDDLLFSFYTELTSIDDSFDVNQYAQDIIELINSKLSTPFNMPDDFDGDFYKARELRWFIKGYNEVLVLSNDNGAIGLTIYDCP